MIKEAGGGTGNKGKKGGAEAGPLAAPGTSNPCSSLSFPESGAWVRSVTVSVLSEVSLGPRF